MKQLLLLITVIGLFTASCKKQPIECPDQIYVTIEFATKEDQEKVSVPISGGQFVSARDNSYVFTTNKRSQIYVISSSEEHTPVMINGNPFLLPPHSGSIIDVDCMNFKLISE